MPWLALSLLLLLPLSFSLGFLTATLFVASRDTPRRPPSGERRLSALPQESTPGPGGESSSRTDSRFGERAAGTTPIAVTPRIAAGIRLRGRPGGRSAGEAIPPMPPAPNRTTAPISSGGATEAPGVNGRPPHTAGSPERGAA